MQPQLADRLMSVSGLTFEDLKAEGTSALQESSGPQPVFAPAASVPHTSAYLPEDTHMEPRFQAGDLAFFDGSKKARTQIAPEALYLVELDKKQLARYVRKGEKSLYLVADDSLDKPWEWTLVSLAETPLLDVVKGKITFIFRLIQ